MGDPAFFTITDANGDEVVVASETEEVDFGDGPVVVHTQVAEAG